MGFTPQMLVTHRVVVGISDMAVSNSSNIVLSTYALGSCVGVLAYDPKAGVAGLIHIMLPKAGTRVASGEHSPYMFVDTGMPLLQKELFGFKCMKSRLQLALVGGAAVNSPKNFFKIGEDNVNAVREFVSREQLSIVYEDVGGSVNRTLHFSIAEATLTVKKPQETDEIAFK